MKLFILAHIYIHIYIYIYIYIYLYIHSTALFTYVAYTSYHSNADKTRSNVCKLMCNIYIFYIHIHYIFIINTYA